MVSPNLGCLVVADTLKQSVGLLLKIELIIVPLPTPEGPEIIINIINRWGERWGSNPRQPEPQSGALPTELRSPYGTNSTQNKLN